MELHMDSLFPELALPQPDVLWLPDFLSMEEQQSLFEFCRDRLDWQQKSFFWQERQVPIPRLLAWFGEVDYRYSGLYHPACPMPQELRALQAKVERVLAAQGLSARFNSVLMNYYRDGNDSIGMHADKETQLGKHPVIASVSLGAGRAFDMEHMATRTKVAYDLRGGSLLVMKGATQEEWRHGITKQPGARPRINLTFRLTHA
jgi:alkylated DNA repair dioxygenase AlkB